MTRFRLVVAASAVLAVCLALVLAAVAGTSLGATSGTAAARLAAVEDGWRRRAGVPGVVVAVSGGDPSREAGRPWLRASGTAERGGSEPLSPDARFRIASITKPFVAVVVLQLVEEGRLALDAQVATYLPDASVTRGVTVRQLLSHTSGIPDYTLVNEHFERGLLTNRNRRWSADELIALAGNVRRDFAPGTDYFYSNTGFLVLGQLIEAVTGDTWAGQVRARILSPLHLDATYVDGAETGPPVVAGYFDTDDDGDEENIETGHPWTSLATSEGAAGAIVSTAADLTAFADALFSGRLLNPAMLHAMTTEQPFHPRGRNYGLGLEISKPDYTTTIWGHGGFVPGFRSTLWHVPSTGVTVVVLAGDSMANTPDLAELILRASGGIPEARGG